MISDNITLGLDVYAINKLKSKALAETLIAVGFFGRGINMYCCAEAVVQRICKSRHHILYRGSFCHDGMCPMCRRLDRAAEGMDDVGSPTVGSKCPICNAATYEVIYRFNHITGKYDL